MKTTKSTDSPVGTMETRMKQWGAHLDDLVAKAGEVSTDARSSYQKRVNDLKAKHTIAQNKFNEFKTAGSEECETFKVGAESTWNELEGAFKDLTNSLPIAAKPAKGEAKDTLNQRTTTTRPMHKPGASKSSSHAHHAQTHSLTTKGNKK